MKKTALILAFLVCFISLGCQGFPKPNPGNKPKPEGNSIGNGDIARLDGEIKNIKGDIEKLRGPGDQDKRDGTNQGTSKKIPVTPNIVQFLQRNKSEGIRFYLSRPFTLKIYEKNETKDIEISNNMIILNPINPDKSEDIIFSVDSEGVLNDIPKSENGNEIQIRFHEPGKSLSDQGRIFRFRRNGQYYELFEVRIIDNRNYKTDMPSEPIQLLVSGEDNRKPEVQAVPTGFVPNNNAQFIQQNINFSGNSGNYSYNNSILSSKKVKDPSSLKPEDVITYIKRVNPAWNDWQFMDIAIIREYFEEARNEGINADIAIAQMLHWTNYFKKRDRVATCNYGGLSSIGKFNGKFPTVTEGIRAHIQHLKAYAKETPNRKPIVDPRYKLAYDRGFSGINFEQVCRSWSQDPRYGPTIEDILRGLYQTSGIL